MENTVILKILDLLPTKVKNALNRLSCETLSTISEVRMRSSNVTTVTLNGENLYLCDTGISREPVRCVRVSSDDIDEFIYRLCGGSVYSYEETVKRGYITKNGFRAGLCGHILSKNGEMCGFTQITGINLRIPNHFFGCSKPLLRYIAKNGFAGGGGILVISPPGTGKTTLLRDLAIGLSRDIRKLSVNSGKVYRVSIIDERSEIYLPEYFSGCTADVFSGISKSAGLECAARVMSPEIIICDEIGSDSDAKVLASAHIGGVTLIASMHGIGVSSALNNHSVKALIDSGVFTLTYVLSRTNGKITGELFDTGGEKISC